MSNQEHCLQSKRHILLFATKTNAAMFLLLGQAIFTLIGTEEHSQLDSLKSQTLAILHPPQLSSLFVLFV